MACDLSVLNAKQREAALLVNGPVLVLAGPGSGKTRTLTHRIAHIVEEGYASPHGILAVTFTKKAGWELRKRLGDLIGERAKDITAGTIHAFAYQILSAECKHLGFKPDTLKVVGQSEAQRVLTDAIKSLGLDEGRWNPKEIGAIIDRAKDDLYMPADLAKVKGGFFEQTVARVYARYQELLREGNAMDYGDLISYSIQVLRIRPEALEFWQNLFQYVSVDEFQDTSFGQYQLIRHLVWTHHNLYAVGSPIQAIYSWRGADIANILTRFRQDFPDAPRIVLGENYRSSANVLNASQAVVHNLPYREDLTPNKPDGDPITVVTAHTDWAQSEYIVREIKRLVNELGYAPNDCAVLFRTRSQVSQLESLLVHTDLPYTIVGEYKFFNRKEIKDILAYLHLAVDALDSAALTRIINRPTRGLGQQTQMELQKGRPLTYDVFADLPSRTDLKARVKAVALEFSQLVFETIPAARDTLPLPEFIDFVVQVTKYGDMMTKDTLDGPKAWSNVRLLRSLAQNYVDQEDPLRSFLADVEMLDDGDIVDKQDQGILLATIHGVEGLEFPVVFIAGLEEGTFPHNQALKVAGGLEEEQRLMFVAMTHAMQKLYLCWSRSRMVKDTSVDCKASRFLAALPRKLIEHLTPERSATVSPKVPLEPEVTLEPELAVDTPVEPTTHSGPLPPLDRRSWDVPVVVQPAASNAAPTPAASPESAARVAASTAPAMADDVAYEPPDEAAESLLEHEVEEVAVWFESAILQDLAPYEDTLPDEAAPEMPDELDDWLSEMQSECLEHIMEEEELALEGVVARLPPPPEPPVPPDPTVPPAPAPTPVRAQSPVPTPSSPSVQLAPVSPSAGGIDLDELMQDYTADQEGEEDASNEVSDDDN